MALSKEILDGLGLEIAKKKYYNATKVENAVEALLERLKTLTAENEQLRAQVNSISSSKDEIGDAILSAKAISQQMIAEARRSADELLSAAREQAAQTRREAEQAAEQMLSDRKEEQERVVGRVQEYYLKLRESQMDAVHALDTDFQDFLCSLDESPAEVPADLSEKVGAIADELFSFDDNAES